MIPLARTTTLLTLALLLGTDALEACTLLGAAGRVAGGKVLLSKTRDRRTRFVQVLREKSHGRHRAIGIASLEDGRLTSGINDRGLAVVQARVSTRRERARILVGPVLAHAGSVDEAIRWLVARRPRGHQILLLGDVREIALVQIAPGNPPAVHRTGEGVIVHTNHLIGQDLEQFNTVAPSRSSRRRLARGGAILAGVARRGPIGRDDLIAACRDHEGGPGDLSICRHSELDGLAGGTISAAVYELAPGRAPRAFVCLGQPCAARFVEITTAPLADRPDLAPMTRGRVFRLAEVRRALDHGSGPVPQASKPSIGSRPWRPPVMRP